MGTYGGMNHEPLFASSHSTRHIQIMAKTIVSVPKNVFLQLPFSVKLNIFTYIFLKNHIQRKHCCYSQDCADWFHLKLLFFLPQGHVRGQRFTLVTQTVFPALTIVIGTKQMLSKYFLTNVIQFILSSSYVLFLKR